MTRLVLASKSPRRSEILKTAGFEFTVRTAPTDESLPENISPKEAVMLLAKRKAEAVKREKDEIILGADTLVCLEGKILGKPQSRSEAQKMLEALSGKTHYVYTGVCGIDSEGETLFCEETAVKFSQMDKEEISAYLDTGESMDKAGAYGIQGYASRFIEGIKGDYFNVVGLPLRAVYEKI